MRAILVAVMILAGAFAGCLNEEDTPVDSSSANNSTSEFILDEDRPDTTTGGNITLGAAAPPDETATLAEVPKLQVGEWWKIHIVSPLDGTDVEIVRVLAKEEDDLYVFGMPHEGWYKEAMIYHSPGFGDVNKVDLSYRAHNIPFLPLQFPLTDGQTWTTNFETEVPLTAKVSLVDQYTADITFTNPNGALVVALTYDARIHEVSKFHVDYMDYEVVAHGYGFEGWVTVPRGEQLVFLHGRIASLLGVSTNPPQPGPPMEQVVIDEEFNRVTFLVAALPIAGNAGLYRETVTDPVGTQYVVESLNEGPKLVYFESKDVKGTWNLEHISAGPGYVFTEGVAYHQYDIRVPDGAIRTDHSHPVVR